MARKPATPAEPEALDAVVSVRMPTSLRDALNAHAREQRRSASQQAMLWIEQGLERDSVAKPTTRKR